MQLQAQLACGGPHQRWSTAIRTSLISTCCTGALRADAALGCLCSRAAAGTSRRLFDRERELQRRRNERAFSGPFSAGVPAWPGQMCEPCMHLA